MTSSTKHQQPTGVQGDPMPSQAKLRRIQLRNCGDWNGEQAMHAWAEGDVDRYARLIRQADQLWAMAGDE